MIKSRICEILGIEYPLFQGGMAWIADASLASAVSNAGGLGLISSINAGTEAVRAEIRKCKELTDKPFGVNIMLQAPNAGEIARMVVEEGVKILTTGAGTPAPYMEMWKEADIKVIPVIASVALALKVQALGATAVVAEGAESGGHVGELHTMAADECTVHQNYKDRIIKASDISTIVTGKTLGHPVRSLKTPFSNTFAKMEADPSVKPEEILSFGTGALRRAVKEGDPDGSYMAGECAGMVKRTEPARDIVADIIGGAERLLSEAGSRLV